MILWQDIKTRLYKQHMHSRVLANRTPLLYSEVVLGYAPKFGRLIAKLKGMFAFCQICHCFYRNIVIRYDACTVKVFVHAQYLDGSNVFSCEMAIHSIIAHYDGQSDSTQFKHAHLISAKESCVTFLGKHKLHNVCSSLLV